MITLRVTAEVKDDRRVVLTLPPEVPTGRAELVVTVGSAQAQPRGVPASAVRGIGAGDTSPPDDSTIERWLDEHRAEKFG
jgi:hypothetical protein